MRPTALDLCAGAGGLSLGLQAAGYDVLGVELDPVAAEWHRAHVGPCVTESIATFHPAGPVDLVAGGVPCQPYSAAGLRGGLDDARGQLFRHLVRIAVEADARAVVLENVVGLLTWGRGAALRAITEAFEAAGYRTTWTVLDAADFGVPQHRRRLFVVGLRDGRIQWPQPTHGPTLTAWRPWVSVREALGLGGGVYESGRIPGATGWNGQRMLDVDRPSTTTTSRNNADLLSRPARTITSSTHDETADPERPSRRYGAALGRPSPTVTANFDHQGRGERASQRKGTELADALAVAGLADRPSTAIQAHGSGRVAPAGHHDRQWNGAVRLTAAQCATLQGFPAWDWSGLTRGDAHRLIGNAVPPALGEAVGRAVRLATEIEVAA